MANITVSDKIYYGQFTVPTIEYPSGPVQIGVDAPKDSAQ
jgi:hypothetical protein